VSCLQAALLKPFANRTAKNSGLRFIRMIIDERSFYFGEAFQLNVITLKRRCEWKRQTTRKN